MAAVSSTMMPLGTLATDFLLIDTVSQKKFSLQELKSEKATLVMFICNHCKYVKHIHATLVNILHAAIPKGLSVIAISANDVVNFPEDAPQLMKQQALESGYLFPYLYDETQEVARAYDAACTPDFFLFDGNMKLVYRGQFDNSRPKNELPVTGKDLNEAIMAVLSGKQVNIEQRPSIGCNIKWKE
ncbi:MAG TPA: thioredoxin family protein [Cytophagaceae bacterium]|jgi:thiol-disulfide isomerase/thioredoxin|nr:thioredoxin family protein [Cytophagaceae bacterium]